MVDPAGPLTGCEPAVLVTGELLLGPLIADLTRESWRLGRFWSSWLCAIARDRSSSDTVVWIGTGGFGGAGGGREACKPGRGGAGRLAVRLGNLGALQ